MTHAKKPKDGRRTWMARACKDRLDIIVLVLAVWCSACAASAASLRPRELKNDQGAFFGRIVILHGGRDVTHNCRAVFTDRRVQRKAYVRLDRTGWVFGAAALGPTYVSAVRCSFGGLISDHWGRDLSHLDFDIRGKGTVAYFGDLLVESDYSSHHGEQVAGALLGGALGAALFTDGTIRAAQSGSRTGVWRQARFLSAQSAYRRRYPSDQLRPVMGFAPPAPPPAAPAPKPQGGGLLSKHAELNGVTIHWLGRPSEDVRTVAIRLVREANKAQLSGCRELALTLDGRAATYPLTHKVRLLSTTVEEAVQTSTVIETIEQLAAAQSVELQLCDRSLPLSPEAIQSARAFAAEFRAAIHVMSPETATPSEPAVPTLHE